MGGQGSGRRPNFVNKFNPVRISHGTIKDKDYIELPNLSGVKKFADERNLFQNSSVEGTAVLSTGEGGGTKYLREDGDGTCSWQTPAGAGDVTAAVNLTDGTIVQGDGGAKGVKTSTATVGQIANNVAHVADVTGDPHNIAADTLTFTNKTFDADGAGNSITNIDNADIKAGAAIDVSKTALVAGTNITLSTNTLNVDDAFLKNDAVDVGVGLSLTGDNSSADTTYVPNVLYNTDATPPTASTTPIGTIYIQYTA